jgi:hypothetical protein
MRALIAATVMIFVAGCATVTPTSTNTVYDHKYNETHYVANAQQSDFVGTSAKAPAASAIKPSWYAFGHP